MVDIKTVEKQLRKIKFEAGMWNRAEARELPNILLPDEKIKECANGMYEGGFALLVATDMRVLLIDKKPLNFLTVEDLRFDMITEIDYSHRVIGATITISAGSKTLRFKSYNQPRLRKLISLVQHRMQEIKKEVADKTENQQQHLEEINKQLQMYLLAQHQQLQQQIQQTKQSEAATVPKPDPGLSDYLFAQRLLEQFQKETNSSGSMPPLSQPRDVALSPPTSALSEDIAAEGQKEIFGKVMQTSTDQAQPSVQPAATITDGALPKSLEVNPLKIAYSKLPMVLRNRKFGRGPQSSYALAQAAAKATQATA